MNRYIGFDVVKFLKESRGWEEEKKKLQEELDSITEIQGKDNSPVRSRRINDRAVFLRQRVYICTCG